MFFNENQYLKPFPKLEIFFPDHETYLEQEPLIQIKRLLSQMRFRKLLFNFKRTPKCHLKLGFEKRNLFWNMVHVQGLSLKVFSMSWKLMEVNVQHKHNISDIPDFFAEASFFFFFCEVPQNAKTCLSQNSKTFWRKYIVIQPDNAAVRYWQIALYIV